MLKLNSYSSEDRKAFKWHTMRLAPECLVRLKALQKHFGGPSAAKVVEALVDEAFRVYIADSTSSCTP